MIFQCDFGGLLGTMTEARREPKLHYFWAYFFHEFWKPFGLRFGGWFWLQKRGPEEAKGTKGEPSFSSTGSNENEPPGPSRTPCKCVPELLPKKLGKRHENDEPRGSKNCLKMGPKMDPKIIAILGCLGAPQTTSNDAPIGSENRPENHVWIPIFFVKMLAPKMNPKWLPKSSPNDHEKQTKFWCENEPRMRPRNTSKNTFKGNPQKSSKNQSNLRLEKNLFMSGNGKRWCCAFDWAATCPTKGSRGQYMAPKNGPQKTVVKRSQ